MTGARIIVVTPHVRPVIDGRWHLTRLSRLPAPGEPVTTLCGEREPADYSGQPTQITVTTCWDCDLAYREAHGMHILPTHPARRER